MSLPPAAAVCRMQRERRQRSGEEEEEWPPLLASPALPFAPPPREDSGNALVCSLCLRLSLCFLPPSATAKATEHLSSSSCTSSSRFRAPLHTWTRSTPGSPRAASGASAFALVGKW